MNYQKRLASGHLGVVLKELSTPQQSIHWTNCFAAKLLLFRFNTLKAQYRKGVITREEYQVGQNRITESTLYILDGNNSIWFFFIHHPWTKVATIFLFITLIIFSAWAFSTRKSPLPDIPAIKGIITNEQGNTPVADARILIGADTIYSTTDGEFIFFPKNAWASEIPIKVIDSRYHPWSGFINAKDWEQSFNIKLQKKISIWLADFKYDSQEGNLARYEQAVARGIKSMLVDHSAIQLVSRGDDFSLALEELNLPANHQDIFHPDKIVQKGSAHGANYIIKGALSKEEQSIELELEVIDIRTISAVFYTRKNIAEADLAKAIRPMVQKMIQRITQKEAI